MRWAAPAAPLCVCGGRGGTAGRQQAQASEQPGMNGAKARTSTSISPCVPSALFQTVTAQHTHTRHPVHPHVRSSRALCSAQLSTAPRATHLAMSVFPCPPCPRALSILRPLLLFARTRSKEAQTRSTMRRNEVKQKRRGRHAHGRRKGSHRRKGGGRASLQKNVAARTGRAKGEASETVEEEEAPSALLLSRL